MELSFWFTSVTFYLRIYIKYINKCIKIINNKIINKCIKNSLQKMTKIGNLLSI